LRAVVGKLADLARVDGFIADENGKSVAVGEASDIAFLALAKAADFLETLVTTWWISGKGSYSPKGTR